MQRKGTKTTHKPVLYTEQYDDYDEDTLIAMAQYERVIRNSNRIKVNNKKYNKRQNRRYEDDI